MKKIVVKCGCGRVLKQFSKEEDKQSCEIITFAGECEECSLNGGDYAKSSNWKEDPVRPPSPRRKK